MPKKMLEHVVVHKLAERPQSGYGLVKEIETCTGQKPSYGSMYPLLERLAEEGIVSVRESGRKKIYSLTAKGRKKLESVSERRERLVEDLSARMKALMGLFGEDPGPLEGMFDRMKRGEPPIGAVTMNMIRFRDEMFRAVQDGRVERNKKALNAMLVKMRKAVERMQ